MLFGDFFEIEHLEGGESSMAALVRINAAHSIFNGHFPGQPVVPGVCMIQMVQEILEVGVGRRAILRQADSLKFLAIIDPVQNPHVSADIKWVALAGDQLRVTASLRKENMYFFKMNALFSLAG